MSWSEFKNKKWVRIFLNSYVLLSIIFIIWMFFFDENNYQNHLRFNQEINELENSIKIYKDKIAKDEEMIEKLQDSLQLERFAREKYLLKRDNEDVYIIQYDTVKE